MQLNSFSELWRIAERHAESGIRQVKMTEIMDNGNPDQVWYQGKVPGFRLMAPSELLQGAKFGMKFQTVIITPPAFLPWFRQLLEAQGVKFQRTYVKSLRDLKGLGSDVLVNATGSILLPMRTSVKRCSPPYFSCDFIFLCLYNL